MANTPASFGLSGAAATAASSVIPAERKLITVTNRSSSPEVWITLDGSAPTVGGANSWYLASGVSRTIPVLVATQTTPISAIGSAAWAIWVEVNE